MVSQGDLLKWIAAERRLTIIAFSRLSYSVFPTKECLCTKQPLFFKKGGHDMQLVWTVVPPPRWYLTFE
jgi:hypothetical protein